MSVHQVIGDPKLRQHFAFDGTLAVPQYCLMWYDDDDVKPAASLADQLTEAANQSEFARRFAGVALDSRTVNDTNADTHFPVATDIELEIDCVSATFEKGDLVAIDEDSGGTFLENLKVVKTSSKAAAIGVVTKREASAVTKVTVRLTSNLITVPHAGGLVAEEVTFAEAGDTVYTGTVKIPAGATIVDIIVCAIALWDDGTSASLEVGDDNDADGFYTAVDLKATDLLAEQSLSFSQSGGVGGAYLAGTATHWTDRVDVAAERTITGTVAAAGGDGSAGRTRMTVIYSMPKSVAAVGTTP